MNPALLSPSGLPRAGLVAWHDLWFPNVLLQSDTFTTWVRSRSYVAPNCAADPYTGAYTVDKFVEDNTAGNAHMMSQAGVPVTNGSPVTASFLVRDGGRRYCALDFWDGTHDALQIFYDLVAGTVGYAKAGSTGAITSVGGGWYWVTGAFTPDTASGGIYLHAASGTVGAANLNYSGLGHSGATQAGGDTDTAILAATASATDDVYNGTELIFSDAPTVIHAVTDYNGTTKACDFSPARAAVGAGLTYYVGPGIYVARAQLYPSATLPPYSATTTLQSESGLLDLSGNGNHLSRGSNASTADTNDVAILGPGVSGLTDDYAKSAATGINKAGPFTLIWIGKPTGTSGTLLSLTDSATANTKFQRILYSGAGKVKAGSVAGGAESLSDELAVSATDYQMLALTSDGTTLTLRRMDTGTTVTVTDTNPDGNACLGLGCTVGSTVANIADAFEALESLAYGRCDSLPELMRIHRQRKAIWAARGKAVL